MKRHDERRNDDTPLILVISDEKSLSTRVTQVLRSAGYRTIVADRAGTAVSVAERYEPNAVLLDELVDDGQGLEICEQIRSRLRTADTPVVLISAEFDSDAVVERSFDMGATDLLDRPIRESLLLARLRVALREARLREEYKRLATQDHATGLDNRRQFFLHACEAIETCRRQQRETYLVICDVDRLSAVNAEYGYDLGDEIILMLARLTRRLTSADCRVGRLGGDAIAIIFKCADEARANSIADRVLRTFAAIAFDASTQPKHFTLSIGMSHFDGVDAAYSADHLMAHADRALFIAKQRGGRQICRYWTLDEKQRTDPIKPRHARQRDRQRTERGFVRAPGQATNATTDNAPDSP